MQLRILSYHVLYDMDYLRSIKIIMRAIVVRRYYIIIARKKSVEYALAF